jgi:hypothetical protein
MRGEGKPWSHVADAGIVFLGLVQMIPSALVSTM